MAIYIPYFYIIQDVRNGMYYAGSKYGKDANPDNFMVEGGYITSSNLIKDLIEQHGLNVFTIRRIIIFKTGKEAYDYETSFLERIDAVRNPTFYNGHNNTLLGAGTEEYKNMMVERYGVDHNMKIPSVQESRKNKINKKWGSMSNMLKSTGAKEKSHQTTENRYGVRCGLLTEKAVRRRELRCLEKYGVKNAFQSQSLQKEMRQKGLITFAKNRDVKNKPIIQEILSSDIDFSKLGWTTKVSKILGISPQKVKRWMIRNMPEFYEDNCYKRKSPNKK